MRSNATITQYYQDVTFDYRLFWNLDQSMAIRIGLWDHKTRSVAEALHREDRFLAEEVGITERDHVLDAGCGVGGSAIYLAKTYGCRVTGITQSAQQASIATRNAQRHQTDHLVRFIVRDFHDTGFADATFDVVWAVESISHSARKRNLLGEFLRILKPGGHIIGADYFAAQRAYDHATARLRQRVLKGLCFYEFEYHATFKTYLRAHGFQHIDFFDVTDAALPSARRFNRLSWLGSVTGDVLRVLGLRTKAQNDLARGLRSQYVALRNRIHQYRVFCAEKPSPVLAMDRSEQADAHLLKGVQTA